MDSHKPVWENAAIFICEKCGSREGAQFNNPNFAEDCKKEFKAILKDQGKAKVVRVMTSGCLGTCPPQKQAVAVFKENQKEILVISEGEKSELLNYIQGLSR